MRFSCRERKEVQKGETRLTKQPLCKIEKRQGEQGQKPGAGAAIGGAVGALGGGVIGDQLQGQENRQNYQQHQLNQQQQELNQQRRELKKQQRRPQSDEEEY